MQPVCQINLVCQSNSYLITLTIKIVKSLICAKIDFDLRYRKRLRFFNTIITCIYSSSIGDVFFFGLVSVVLIRIAPHPALVDVGNGSRKQNGKLAKEQGRGERGMMERASC